MSEPVIVYGLSRTHDDFTAGAGQRTFSTSPAYPRSNYVEVFKDGMLMRPTVDYQTVAFSGSVHVTFNYDLSVGAFVTVFYYR